MIKKAFFTTAVSFLLFMFSTGYGQASGVKGRVVDEKNAPVQGALTKLITAKKADTTGSDGCFLIEMPTRVFRLDPVSDVISFNNGILSLNVSGDQNQINIEVFDTKGQRISKVMQDGISKGTYDITVLPNNLPVAMYLVKLQIGNRSGVLNVLNLKSQTYSLPGKGLSFEKKLVKQAAGTAIVDSLEISKTGFETVKKAISSFPTDFADIVLKAVPDVGLPPVVNGKSAKTTRYWDCCKPSCGWRSAVKVCDKNNNKITDPNAKSGCDAGGVAFQCWDFAPVEVNSKVSYAWAAFNNQGTQCGDCFQLDLQGALSGKQLVVQVINVGDGGLDAFDLLIPGGGVGALNGCSTQWGNVPMGVQYGGFHSQCGNNADCIRSMCQAAFGEKQDLMRGCNWYLNWFKMTSNPQVMYMKVPCPQGIKNISGIGN
jgi:hypothetical protein